MRNYTMSDGQALNKIRPRSRAARNQLLALSGFFCILAVGTVATVAYSKHWTQQYREQNWNSAVATVEDVRTRLVGQASGQTGSAMIYDVEVLAKFSVNGSPQERWIAVDQPPGSLDSIHFQQRLWMGKSHFVRWNPSDPTR